MFEKLRLTLVGDCQVTKVLIVRLTVINNHWEGLFLYSLHSVVIRSTTKVPNKGAKIESMKDFIRIIFSFFHLNF